MQPTDLADPQQTPDDPEQPETETDRSEPETATETDRADSPAATDPDRAVQDAVAVAQPPGRLRRLLANPRVSIGLTVLACVVVFVALLFPNVLRRLTVGSFVRIPIEAAAGLALLAVLPRRPRIVLASIGGVVLGWLVLEKSLDMGWFEILARPFDPVLDWSLLGDTYGFIREAYGHGAGYAAVAGVVLLGIGVPALTTWAVLRVAALTARHRRRAGITAGGIAAVWMVALLLGVQVVPQVPLAARTTVTYAFDRAGQARAGLANEAAFNREVKADPYQNTPPAQMLSALRGKDVIFAFVESYGRNAIEDPALAPGVSDVLAEGQAKLQQAGYAGRSGWLTSPTFGGNSWLAHSTLLSGLWINNQGRYRNLTASDRLTLPRTFRQNGWDTVSVMPGATRAWPEGAFYGFNRVWDTRNLGYQGPKFAWAPMPDQYTLKQFTENEYKKPGRPPLMAEIPLVSSHTPWTRIPEFLDWDQVGDGSIYETAVAEKRSRAEVWASTRKVKKAYGDSIEYTLTTLIDWVHKYGDDKLVMVFLGDHQPSTAVAGENASRDVPITIVTKDAAVLDKVSAWNWTEGLEPATQAPVWPMNTFRDRFYTTFGTGPGTPP